MIGVPPLRDHAAPRAAQRAWARCWCSRRSTSPLAIITEATLSFLGVGVPPTQPSLGTLIRIGNDFLFSGEWWITVFPGRDAGAARAVGEPARRLAARRAQPEAALNRCRDVPLLEVEQPARRVPDPARHAGRASTTSRSTSRPARCSAWSANRAPASRSPAPRSSACSSRRAASPAARSGSKAGASTTCRTSEMRAIRGREIGAIFQDPLTSLNPLYTIGRQLVETIQHPPAAERRARRARARSRCSQETGIPAAERAHRPLSAPVLRRHAPARRDRAGAGGRAAS